MKEREREKESKRYSGIIRAFHARQFVESAMSTARKRERECQEIYNELNLARIRRERERKGKGERKRSSTFSPFSLTFSPAGRTKRQEALGQELVINAAT